MQETESWKYVCESVRDKTQGHNLDMALDALRETLTDYFGEASLKQLLQLVPDVQNLYRLSVCVTNVVTKKRAWKRSTAHKVTCSMRKILVISGVNRAVIRAIRMLPEQKGRHPVL